MKTTTLSLSVTSTISDVERDTGIAKETLRVWERRYGFPQPLRDPNDERIYPPDQIRKLRLVKRLIDLGFRPGKVIPLNAEELQAMAERATAGNDSRVMPHPELQIYLDLCKTHAMEALRRKLSQALLVMGLKSFVTDLVAPLTELVGEAWAGGQLAVFEEHLYTESLKIVLRGAMSTVPQANAGNRGTPRILLTTLPQERYSVGLMMIEALSAVDGAHCISLGVQTPLLDIVEAARTLEVDIVALSFSAAMNPRQALGGLSELHALLPESIELWASDSCPVLTRRAPPYVHMFGLAELSDMNAQWRARHHLADLTPLRG